MSLEVTPTPPKLTTFRKVLLSLVALSICLFIWVCFMPGDKAKANVDGKTGNMDSIVALIKKDTLYEIKDVYFDKKDSAMRIAFTNKDNTIKEGFYSTNYFDSTYHLNRLENVEGTYLYAYKRHKSLAHGDYKSTLTYTSARLARVTKGFDDKYYFSSIHTYQPLYDAVKASANDPESVEFTKSGNNGMNEDSTFSINAFFRAKNGFGALTLHGVTCDISLKGDVTKLKLDI